jgi:hypothetical protein
MSEQLTNGQQKMSIKSFDPDYNRLREGAVVN